MTLLDDNLSLIRAHDASIATLLEETAAMPCERLSGGVDTLVVNGKQLTSSYDRAFESGFQADEAPVDATSVTLYGWGLGDVQRVLLEREQLTQLQVVLLHPGAIRAGLEHFDQRDWLADPRVELVLAADVAKVGRPLAMSAGIITGPIRLFAQMASHVFISHLVAVPRLVVIAMGTGMVNPQPPLYAR